MDDFEEFKKMMLEASEAHFQRKEAIDKVTEIYQGYVKRIDEAENVFTGVEGDIPPPEFFLSAMTELMQFMVGFLNGRLQQKEFFPKTKDLAKQEKLEEIPQRREKN